MCFQKPTLQKSALDLYKLIAIDVVDINERWKSYEYLYQNSRLRVELLNKSASYFFGRLQRILLDDLILGITRLSDPAQQGKSENQSLPRLKNEVFALGHFALAESLDLRLTDIKSQCCPFKTHRNKRVAHTDLRLKANPHEVVLPNIPPKDFVAAIKSMNEFLNDFENHFEGLTITGYDHVIQPYLDSADGLIWTLQKAAALDVLLDPMDHWDAIAKTEFRGA